MNKQELIEHISNTLDERLRNTIYTLPIFSIKESAKGNEVSLELKTERVGIVLDRVPQKPVVPQYVADWIEYAKNEEGYNVVGAVTEAPEGQIGDWLILDNVNTFARAWLDGYTVRKEKRYLVKIIGITDYNSYLNYHKGKNKWTIESRMETDAIRTEHTRKELEEAGFGEVFNSPLFEVEEVENE